MQKLTPVGRCFRVASVGKSNEFAAASRLQNQIDIDGARPIGEPTFLQSSFSFARAIVARKSGLVQFLDALVERESGAIFLPTGSASRAPTQSFSYCVIRLAIRRVGRWPMKLGLLVECRGRRENKLQCEASGGEKLFCLVWFNPFARRRSTCSQTKAAATRRRHESRAHALDHKATINIRIA